MVKLLSAIIYNNVPYSLGGSRVPEGGTKIGPVLGYLEEHRDYDSLIITTWAGMFTWKKVLLTYIPHVKM